MSFLRPSLLATCLLVNNAGPVGPFELLPLDLLCLPPQDYLDAMVGVCYDGVEGTLYLCLFSSLAACAFTVMLCAIPRAWRQIACK